MTLIAVGVSHNTASVELRGKLSIPEDRLNNELVRFIDYDALSEVVIISTCNRCEVYAAVTTAPDGVNAVIDALRTLPNMNKDTVDQLDSALFIKQGTSVVDHLFRVVASLDSLVLGEAQIIGQVRRAYAAAEEAGSVGELTRHLFHSALEVGKRVRSETSIGARSVSVSTAAVELAKREIGLLDTCRVLVIGAGSMGELALTYLQEQGVHDVVVANRTLSHAVEITERVGGTPVGLDQLETELGQADLVLASAAADEVLIPKGLLENARAKSGKSSDCLVIVDIALPRTVDPACGDLNGVTYCDLDGLGDIVNKNARLRTEESVKASMLVADQVTEFLSWLQKREVTPTIKQIYDKAHTICDAEATHAAKKLATIHGSELDEREIKVLEDMASAVAKKLLHGPTARLRKQVGEANSYCYTEAARYLFGLDAYPNGFVRCDDGRVCPHVSGLTCSQHTNGELHGEQVVSATLSAVKQKELV